MRITEFKTYIDKETGVSATIRHEEGSERYDVKASHKDNILDKSFSSEDLIVPKDKLNPTPYEMASPEDKAHYCAKEWVIHTTPHDGLTLFMEMRKEYSDDGHRRTARIDYPIYYFPNGKIKPLTKMMHLSLFDGDELKYEKGGIDPDTMDRDAGFFVRDNLIIK